MNGLIKLGDIMGGGRIPVHVAANMIVQVLLKLINILWLRGVLNDEDTEKLANTAQEAQNWAIKNP